MIGNGKINITSIANSVTLSITSIGSVYDKNSENKFLSHSICNKVIYGQTIVIRMIVAYQSTTNIKLDNLLFITYLSYFMTSGIDGKIVLSRFRLQTDLESVVSISAGLNI